MGGGLPLRLPPRVKTEKVGRAGAVAILHGSQTRELSGFLYPLRTYIAIDDGRRGRGIRNSSGGKSARLSDPIWRYLFHFGSFSHLLMQLSFLLEV